MGQSHEAPGGEALRQRELQAHTTCLVSHELRIEEGCFLQVLPSLGLLHRLGIVGSLICFFSPLQMNGFRTGLVRYVKSGNTSLKRLIC